MQLEHTREILRLYGFEHTPSTIVNKEYWDTDSRNSYIVLLKENDKWILRKVVNDRMKDVYLEYLSPEELITHLEEFLHAIP